METGEFSTNVVSDVCRRQILPVLFWSTWVSGMRSFEVESGRWTNVYTGRARSDCVLFVSVPNMKLLNVKLRLAVAKT